MLMDVFCRKCGAELKKDEVIIDVDDKQPVEILDLIEEYVHKGEL